MSANPIVSVRHVSKAYAVYERPLDVVKEAVFGGTRHDLFWALKDVSFDVYEGQRIGLIGPNGAGKTTLLKLIAGTLQQTAGSIDVHGRISAMLSLTSFLNPDETGLENIRFNLIVNGAERTEIPRLTEEIVEFTELGAFVHAPVRTYSSGMSARLAFAISTAIRPDILIVDEVLSAGDAYFASKSTMRMVELTNQGRALLFVSHAMNAVQLLCDTAIWIDSGSIREIGAVDQVAAHYEADYRRQEDDTVRSGNAARRERRADRVGELELVRRDVDRLRLTGPGGRLTDSHYVRKLTLGIEGEATDVPLDFVNIDGDGVQASLDLIHSEWGRAHHRRGSESRALARSSRPLRGGHLLITGTRGTSRTIRLTVESTGIIGAEMIVAQRIDFAEGTWVDLDVRDRQELSDGWTRSVFEGTLDSAETGLDEERLVRLLEESRPDVEIVETSMIVDGIEAYAVRERQPFSIGVRIRANLVVPVIDVNLKFVRADGVYMFSQSSGVHPSGNVEGLAGECVVWFDFDPNVFGPGDYDVTVELGNGFDPERNFPHAEIYDRQVAASRFKVAREWSLIMRGAINHQFPVRVERSSAPHPPMPQPTEKVASSDGQ